MSRLLRPRRHGWVVSVNQVSVRGRIWWLKDEGKTRLKPGNKQGFAKNENAARPRIRLRFQDDIPLSPNL